MGGHKNVTEPNAFDLSQALPEAEHCGGKQIACEDCIMILLKRSGWFGFD